VPINKNEWIIDPFAGTYLFQLPLHLVEDFMDMAAKATKRVTFATFEEKYLNDSANIHF